MMRQMRENTKWIMVLVALAFSGLMLFSWGMDVTGRSAGGLGEIGRVNGTAIMYDDYIATYQSLYEQVQLGQEEPVTSQQNRDLEDAAFDEIVNRILMAQELERRGIRVTDREIQEQARFNPPPAFQQVPQFQTDGRFDLQKYQAFLSAPQTDQQLLRELEAYYRNLIPRGKLMRQVTTGLYLTDRELWERWQDQNETVEIRYIPMNPDQRIDDDDVEVTAQEIEEYYDGQLDDFAVPARAVIRAVVLDKTPTASDTASALQRAVDVRQEILDGADFAEVAARESSDEVTAALGGDLGVFARGRMVPVFDTAVFEGLVGELGEPLQSSFGFHLIEVLERWGQDSVSARHILLPVVRTDDSEIALLTMADSLEDLSESRSLGEAAELLGLEVQEGQLTEDFSFISGAGQVSEGADWAFEEASPNDVSPVFENAQAFYALELVSSTLAGTLSLEDATTTIRSILVLRKKTATARTDAAELVTRIRAGTPLPDVATEAGLEVRFAGPFARNDAVPGIGRHNAAIGASFGLAPGQISDPVTAIQNVFIIEQIAFTPADSAQWKTQQAAQRIQVGALLQQNRIGLWIEGLRAAARILDRRDQVLQPIDDQPLGRGLLGF